MLCITLLEIVGSIFVPLKIFVSDRINLCSSHIVELLHHREIICLIVNFIVKCELM